MKHYHHNHPQRLKETYFDFICRKSQPNEATPKKPKIFEDDDDGSICPICLDNWDTDGAHRLVSLKCGHLFGESCIKR